MIISAIQCRIFIVPVKVRRVNVTAVEFSI